MSECTWVTSDPLRWREVAMWESISHRSSILHRVPLLGDFLDIAYLVKRWHELDRRIALRGKSGFSPDSPEEK